MKKLLVYALLFMWVGCQPLEVMRKDDWLTSVGYASISEQRGRNQEEKQVRAMRASKIDAYRELAE